MQGELKALTLLCPQYLHPLQQTLLRHRCVCVRSCALFVCANAYIYLAPAFVLDYSTFAQRFHRRQKRHSSCITLLIIRAS